MKASIGIIWEQCSDIPAIANNEFIIGKSQIVLNGKVYREGESTQCHTNGGDESEKCLIVCCYDPAEDSWTTLAPLPVQGVGLGAVRGQLVAVGGERDTDSCASNKVYTYNEQSKKWNRTIPPMPTSRIFPGCLSLGSALVVAGGACDSSQENSTNVV